MEGSILVTPEELERTAGEFGTAMAQISTLYSQMMDKVNGMSASWQGEASTAFINKFGQLSDDIMKMKSMIQEHVTDLNEMAAKYREAENANQDVAASLAGDVIS